jgi:hypothetical protein
MNSLLRNHCDKVLLMAATVALTLSCTWLWLQQPALRRLRAVPVFPQLVGSLYEASNLKPPQPVAATWPKAPAQSSGGAWLYEVFTPPVIYYNALARTFSVTPPLNPTNADAAFGLELLVVKPEPFRLQLVGYFGGPGDYLAAFISPSQTETLLAREGRRFEALGLTLKSFDVRKILVEHDAARPVYDVAALAVLQDDQTGAEVVLDSRARKFTDTPLAVLIMHSGDPKSRELREGDTFADATSTYRVERIQLDPPEVVVARQNPGLPVPETRVLRPATGNGAEVAARPPKTFSDRPATAVVTNGQ